MYRHDRLAYLNSLVKKGKKEGFHVGVKLVRGAYIEKETLRSQRMKYPNPLCISKTATDKNFDAGISLLIDNLEHCTLFAGSHNEKKYYHIDRIVTAEENSQQPSECLVWSIIWDE